MFLGVDLGTGSVKALLLSEAGERLGEGSVSYGVRSPRPGWAEADPGEWWEAAGRAVRTAVGERRGEVSAIGLSGQMHGVVLCGADGRCLRPAITWADARSRAQLGLYRGLGEAVLRRLANPPAAGMAGPSLLWLRENEPGLYSGADWALQPKDWMRLSLTGEAAAEPSDASATLLYDLLSDRWDEEVIRTLGLREDLLAPLIGSGATAGVLTGRAARHLGLRPGIPVAAGAADTAAAMLGTGLFSASAGVAQLTIGTGGQIAVPRDEPRPDPARRTHLYRAALPRNSAAPYYAMAAIQNAGLALEWARGVLGVSWEDVEREAFSVPPGAGGVTFLPYLSGERTPVFDPDVRGAWVGLGLSHSRAHLLRAALEGVAFALRDGLEALEATGAEVVELRLAGGGAVGERWRGLLASVLRRPLRPLPDQVGRVASARGAAVLAGLASGVYRSAEDAPRMQYSGDVIEPGSVDYEEPYSRYKELYPRLHRM